jgi:Ca2+/Na+ antiporter
MSGNVLNIVKVAMDDDAVFKCKAINQFNDRSGATQTFSTSVLFTIKVESHWTFWPIILIVLALIVLIILIVVFERKWKASYRTREYEPPQATSTPTKKISKASAVFV